MRDSRFARPTDGELEILGVLWRCGPSTVREVHEQIQRDTARKTAYTTTLKLMQIMVDKGLVQRDQSSRSHVYQASATEQDTQRHLVRDLLTRAFGGSARRLMMSALSATKSSSNELNEIRKLLDQMKGD